MSVIEWDIGKVVVWLISNSVIAGLLAGCAYGCDRALNRPSLAHLLWVLVLVKLVTPPLVELPVSLDSSRVEWIGKYTATEQPPMSHVSVATLADSVDQARLTGFRRAIGVTPPRKPRWFTSPAGLLVYVWVAGAAALVVWIVVATRHLKALIDRRGRFDLSATRQAEALSMPHETTSPPVWLVDAVLSPMLVGTGRGARIVFPKSLWLDLSQDARIALLRHELEHWRRRDSLVRYVEVVAWVVLWWHPLVWIARRQIEVCEERCCDIAASSGSTARRVYADAILATLDFLSEGISCSRPDAGPRPLASGVGELPRIEQRLRQIMLPSPNLQLETPRWLVLMAMIVVIPFCPSIVLRRGVESSGWEVVRFEPDPGEHSKSRTPENRALNNDLSAGKGINPKGL